jgi:hypothetical protein
MSGNISTVILPVSGVGVQAVVGQLPIGVAGAARATLPFTGIALATSLSVALVLVLVGFVLRLLAGARRETA